jgi:ubiquinone/menaquinone biosynthesis C-methylase UbiE
LKPLNISTTFTLQVRSKFLMQLHDQDHYGGTQAVDRLMAQASFTSSDHLLDVCSGVGGPARYISWKSGCRVTGLDLTASRVMGAIELTQAAGMAERVDFIQGNALEMPFDDHSFTCVIGQEAFAHIPNKKQLISECARVLKPGGRMVFSDIMSHQALSKDNADRLFEGMRFSEIATLQDYTSWLATNCWTPFSKLIRRSLVRAQVEEPPKKESPCAVLFAF